MHAQQSLNPSCRPGVKCPYSTSGNTFNRSGALPLNPNIFLFSPPASCRLLTGTFFFAGIGTSHLAAAVNSGGATNLWESSSAGMATLPVIFEFSAQAIAAKSDERLAAPYRPHPPHPGRIFRSLHIQFPVAPTLPPVAGRTNVTGTLGLDPPQHRHPRLLRFQKPNALAPHSYAAHPHTWGGCGSSG